MEQRIPQDSDSFEKDKDTMEFFENENEVSASTYNFTRLGLRFYFVFKLFPQSLHIIISLIIYNYFKY